MRSPIRWFVLTAATLSLVALPARAQERLDPPSSVTTADAAQTQETTSGTFQGLPQRAPEPRTLHDFAAVFAVFVVTWLGIVGYVLRFGGSLERITEKMRVVERRGQP